jgi:hypothetical protein
MLLPKKLPKKILGWREIVSLPGLGIDQITTKLDTGARTAALHVSSYKILIRRNKKIVEFVTHPVQRSRLPTVKCHADFVEYRFITSSNGTRTLRPVILTPIKIDHEEWSIEITLVNRDIMGFRMLLGRETLKKRFLIDPSRSYLSQKRKKS